jgi:hypothetical protein
MFVSDLPKYIIPAGNWILQANRFNESPNHDWLPAPPDLSSFNASSWYAGSSQRLSQRSRHHWSNRDSYSTLSTHRPDPNGLDPSKQVSYFRRVPILAVFMGGIHGPINSNGGLSPLALHDSSTMGGMSVAGTRLIGAHSMEGRSVGSASNAALPIVSMGGAPNAPPPLKVYSVPPTIAPIPALLPSMALLSLLGDSSLDPLVPPAAPPAPLPTPGIANKDKVADHGNSKDITDKETRIKAKKIIDARLRRPPYCPGPDSKTLVTTTDNQVASAWWEEVMNYYVKPPISDLFVEESRFDGKGFEMIDHIDKYFHPSGTVDSLGYIFNLINTIQASAGSVITLKARFSRLFALLKLGGVAIDSALQVGFMLRALLLKYHGIVQDFPLG